jgi:hypothetical protein
MKKCLHCQQEFEDTSRGKNKLFCCTQHQGKYRWANSKDRMLEYNKRYEERNKERVQHRKNTYRKERYSTDVNFKLSLKIRARLGAAIKNNSKSLTNNFGCSISELKTYLESKFEPGMSWDNYCMHGWHIDHIRPLCSFNLSDPNQLREACHYSNLQPLWAKDNLRKSSKFA